MIDITPPPTWNTEDNAEYSRLVRLALQKLKFFWQWNIVHKRNRVKYLRQIGVNIGNGCSIITSIENFGSEPWLIKIGDRVTITKGVIFLTHDGSSRVFRHQIPEASRYGNRFGTIEIQDNSFIGVNSILLPDISIGPHSIVGAGSVVNQDVPPMTVATGVPARVICSLDEYVERYKAKMLLIDANNPEELRKELTSKLWGSER